MEVLKVSQLTKTFTPGIWPFNIRATKFTAVNNVSFSLAQGEILGLLGANGAGKTTTIQMLLGTLIPTQGEIEYFGKPFKKNRSSILQRVSFASSYVKVPPRLTVYQNLDLFARLYGVPSTTRSERINTLLEYFGIADLKNRETGLLSAGQLTRLMLVKAFCSSPSIVLLDEPTASLDPEIARDVREFVLQERKTKGTAFLFTSHNMQEVSAVCDRVLILQQGSLIADDTPYNLARSAHSARLKLLIQENMTVFIELCHRAEYKTETIGNLVTIYLDEREIPAFLHQIAHANVRYNDITILKPTLEEYFIELLSRQKEAY